MRSCTLVLLMLIGLSARGQEGVAPIDHNPQVSAVKLPAAAMKTTALSLPFFEDFTGYSQVPDQSKWTDAQVYINNTMAFAPISRGVATFDALNAKGGPYDSSSSTAFVFADSLTSQPIDMSAHAPADSVYLSFFYQPQGNGFAPETQDELVLFMKRSNGSWDSVWSAVGASVQAFRQIMVPVADTAYFHAGFQFRFVNKASINLNDDIWNLDYVRMDANRNIGDTLVNDMATTIQPSFLLNDYTAMPYRQFAADMTGELNTQHYFYVRNNYNTPQNVTYGYSARETETNTTLFSGTVNTSIISQFAEQQFSFPMYPVSFSAPGPNSKVVFEQKYFGSSGNSTEYQANDTIIQQQVFDNYLAYDDGTAEKSYFLNQFVTLPAMLAVEYHLNQPDTLRGIAIYFGRQVPLALNKFFTLQVWNDIAVNGGTDDLRYQQELMFPGYDSINHFWIYKLDTPQVLPAGTFYIGTQQPASSGSDSLYFGLDVNRLGGNHLYYNVLNMWEPSLVSGAVMVRPLLGETIVGSGVGVAEPQETRWSLYPNPSNGSITVEWEGTKHVADLQLLDAQGRVVLAQTVNSGQAVRTGHLSPGIYFVRIFAGETAAFPKKLIIQ